MTENVSEIIVDGGENIEIVTGEGGEIVTGEGGGGFEGVDAGECSGEILEKVGKVAEPPVTLDCAE